LPSELVVPKLSEPVAPLPLSLDALPDEPVLADPDTEVPEFDVSELVLAASLAPAGVWLTAAMKMATAANPLATMPPEVSAARRSNRLLGVGGVVIPKTIASDASAPRHQSIKPWSSSPGQPVCPPAGSGGSS
jgi:hypothetical protein